MTDKYWKTENDFIGNISQNFIILFYGCGNLLKLHFNSISFNSDAMLE